ncbi:MAG TPA: hypothetical protein VKU94_01840, partial [Geobacterales bacterium]|nr:hypothetical protein [Geobacterales bacterium]
LLIYTNMVDEALDSFIRFINSLKFRLFLMNMLLAMTYSVFPWLSSFKNILSISATNTSFSMILPDFLTVFTYALMLELNSFFMTAVFFEIKSAKKYLLISVSIYLAMQLLLYLVIGKNLVGFYTF